MFRRTAFMAILGLAFIGATPSARAEEDLTFEQALALAQTMVPDGILIRGRVEGDVFGFYFWQRPRVVEIEIMKNKNLKKRVKSDEDKIADDIKNMMDRMVRGKTKLPDGRIMEIAKKSNNGMSPTAYKIEKKDDRLVAVIGDSEIDMQTGKVTKVEKK
ncbi:MAG: hypothetical protein ACRC8S_07305 [Fimbriiglobus sp.]